LEEGDASSWDEILIIGSTGVNRMPTNTRVPDAMHFKSLRLENVRGFASSQSLQLVDEDDKPSRWNLILGENGVGKTTLMEALRVMQPVPSAPWSEETKDAGPPPLSKALLSGLENSDILHFIRRGGMRTTEMDAMFETDEGKIVEIRSLIKGSDKELKDADFPDFDYSLLSEGPLVIFYDAGRHIERANLADDAERETMNSPLLDAVALADAEDILQTIDYKAKSSKNVTDERLLERMKTAVARLLPEDLKADDIEIQGPRLAGSGGVHLQTPSGMMPFEYLSLGYRTMISWTVDLAWRLFRAFPESVDPLSESAIVLIDEVDLHFHPRWQRDIRQRLLEQFTKVQFIATTHNPVTAQQTLSEGGNVAVVGWTGDEAHIHNNPISRDQWRFDQLLTSELFGFDSARTREAEGKLAERLELIRIPNRSPDQEKRLQELDKFVASLPTAHSPSAHHLEELMMDFVKNFPRKKAQ
jgi:AAA domain, putative AbiEii toxin, Type IV TA system